MASIDTTNTTKTPSSPTSLGQTTAAQTDSASVFDTENTGHPLVKNTDAKAVTKKKVSKAIDLIKKYGADYHKKGYGPDFSAELKALGEQNIELAPTKKNRSMADNLYKETTRPSAKTDGSLFSSSKIFVHYNNYDVYNASPEKIAATIVHELGHIEDKDDISSVQEEKDVETQARNFESFIKKPDGFKYDSNPKGIDDFLKLYKDKKNFGNVSPHHGM